MTAAAIARPRSRPLTRFGAAAATGRAPEGAALGVALLAGAEATRAAGAPEGGAGAAGLMGEGGGAAAWAAGAAAEAGAAGGGPPAGNVGSLMVAVGFGGKLMRTVCFLASGLGAPPGGGVAPGVDGLSAICAVASKVRLAAKRVKCSQGTGYPFTISPPFGCSTWPLI